MDKNKNQNPSSNDNCGKSEQIENEVRLNKPICNNTEYNELYLSTYGFLLDRTIQNGPIQVYRITPNETIYNFSYADLKMLSQGQSLKQENISTCVVMEPMVGIYF
jgi:hypothetical protein